MTTEIIIPNDEQHWLQMRTQDITSTEAAALFNLSPYKTEFELFHEKRGGQVVKFEPNERMKWGSRLESAIALGVAEDQGWQVQPLKVYMRDPDLRMGSSFDFEIMHPEHGKGIMEIKNVDGLQYKRAWKDEGGRIEAPEHIELQVQHQMDVSGYKWCAIVAMVGGNTAKIAFRHYDAIIGSAIRNKVKAFWDRVDKNDEPSADYSRDAELIKQLYSQVNEGEIFDATGDAELTRLVLQYQHAKADEAKYGALVASYQAQILQRVGAAEKIVGAFGSISLSKVKDSPATTITVDMVGKTYGGRKGYRQFKPNWKKED